jgi:pilus assembly protein Flp/PilA
MHVSNTPPIRLSSADLHRSTVVNTYRGKEVTPMFSMFTRPFDMYYTYLLARIMPHVKSERGATAVEYGLIVAGIAAVIAAVVITLGGKVKGAFDNVNAAMP